MSATGLAIFIAGGNAINKPKREQSRLPKNPQPVSNHSHALVKLMNTDIKRVKNVQPSTSKGILWGVIQSPLTIPKRYPYGTPHHITLQFGVEREDWKHLEGVEFQASTLYEAWNSKIQAVTVRIPPSIPCQIKTPHISISWCDGVTPYESNLMLASEFDFKVMVSAYKFKIEFLEWIA